jgi:hypothetical protein
MALLEFASERGVVLAKGGATVGDIGTAKGVTTFSDVSMA